MVIELDHIILAVNDKARSIEFYTGIVGLSHDRASDREPFSMLRVTPGFVVQIAQWGTKGGEHLAFSMSKQEFDAAFNRVVAAKIPYGDEYDKVGNMKGPGRIDASKGPNGNAVYFFDPDKHLVEIIHYAVS